MSSSSLCLVCDTEIGMRPEVGLAEIVRCGSCGQDHEVVAVGPAALAIAPEVEEDWGE
jgi:alpha-aminoadipate/glutamate carrier protein LysW